jgi:hypothetical protein
LTTLSTSRFFGDEFAEADGRHGQWHAAEVSKPVPSSWDTAVHLALIRTLIDATLAAACRQLNISFHQRQL